MKKLLVICVGMFLFSVPYVVKSQEMTKEQKISYALGANVAENFKSNEVPILFEYFQKGFEAMMAGKNQLSQAEMQQAFNDLNQMMEEKQTKGALEEKVKSEKFLEENKKKAGIITTASGLQYKVVTMGTGEKPTAADKVKVHYHGTTIDGEVFDSSVERGEPITFPLGGVIPGWTEGVQLMPVGSKFIFYIPSDLAYGDRGAGGIIKPGAALIFEVELISIEK
jgi:FKBP-type peptidyl-prolyl cis-trans isomerase